MGANDTYEKSGTQFPGVRYREVRTRKMSNGRWDRCYFIRYHHAGKRREESVGYASEGWTPQRIYTEILSVLKTNHRIGKGPQTLAEMRAANQERRRAENEDKILNEVRWLTLDDFFERFYLPQAQKEKRTWKHDKCRYDRNVRNELGMIPMSALKVETIRDFLEGLSQKGLSPASIVQYGALVRRIFNVARGVYIEGIPLFSGTNPVSQMKLPKLHNERERFLTHEEAFMLLDAARKSGNINLHDGIALVLETGLRLGELLRLEWNDINFVAGILSVKDEAKRKPGGKIPLSDRAIAILKTRLSGRKKGDTLVFQNWHRTALQHDFSDLVESIGLNNDVSERKDKVVFHTLRHTFASWLALQGTDIYRIKTLMRHKTIEMTMRYSHLLPDAGRNAVNTIWGEI